MSPLDVPGHFVNVPYAHPGPLIRSLHCEPRPCFVYDPPRRVIPNSESLTHRKLNPLFSSTDSAPLKTRTPIAIQYSRDMDQLLSSFLLLKLGEAPRSFSDGSIPPQASIQAPVAPSAAASTQALTPDPSQAPPQINAMRRTPLETLGAWQSRISSKKEASQIPC